MQSEFNIDAHFVPFEECDKTHVVRRFPEEGEPVRIHMDLNRKLVAVRSMDTSKDEYNKTLIKTERALFLEDADFRVQDAAYDHIIESGVRQVCAYVAGQWASQRDWTYEYWNATKDKEHEVRYNPFRHKYFTIQNEDGELIGVKKARVIRAKVDYVDTEDHSINYTLEAKQLTYLDK